MKAGLKTILDQANRGYGYDLRYQKGYGDAKILEMFEGEIRKQLSNSSNARWDLALTIARLVRSGAWTAFHDQTLELYDKYHDEHPGCKCSFNPYYPVGGNWWSENSIYLLTFLKEKFGLCRTTVYNYLEVVDEFATYIDDKGKDPEYRINIEAESYQFWQLIEMTSLTYQERLKVQPNWTREEIRAYKKSLREKKSGKIQPAELVEVEEPPKTEAQQRFAKYSKNDLIDEVVKLEEENKKLAEQVEVLLTKAYPYAKKDGVEAKHELQSVIETLLKSYNYEIQLNGRKQGAKPFAGVIARNILASYSQEKATSSFASGEGEPV